MSNQHVKCMRATRTGARVLVKAQACDHAGRDRIHVLERTRELDPDRVTACVAVGSSARGAILRGAPIGALGEKTRPRFSTYQRNHGWWKTCDARSACSFDSEHTVTDVG